MSWVFPAGQGEGEAELSPDDSVFMCTYSKLNVNTLGITEAASEERSAASRLFLSVDGQKQTFLPTPPSPSPFPPHAYVHTCTEMYTLPYERPAARGPHVSPPSGGELP